MAEVEVEVVEEVTIHLLKVTRRRSINHKYSVIIVKNLDILLINVEVRRRHQKSGH